MGDCQLLPEQGDLGFYEGQMETFLVEIFPAEDIQTRKVVSG